MSRDPNRPADRAVFWTGMLIFLALLIQSAYQYGYDTARAECKPAASYEIKPMTHKQKVRAAQWAMRDRGYIR